MRAPVSVIVLTFNEEANIGACLESVIEWAGEVFVVDSFSTDRTVAIAEAYGARVVQHPFETHAKQWNYSLSNLSLRFDTVLGLDADQRISLELAQSICAVLEDPKLLGIEGYYLPRRQVFRGRWIRFGGYYPVYLLKLFRRYAAHCDENELMDHHFYVRGPTIHLTGDLIEDNRNEVSIATWVDKHNRYAARQAREEWLREVRGLPDPILPALFGSRDARVLWLKRFYRRFPLFVRPGLYFLYRYFLRLGFLDGKEGFLFHLLQGFWYRLLVDVNLDELRRTAFRSSEIAVAEQSTEVATPGKPLPKNHERFSGRRPVHVGR